MSHSVVTGGAGFIGSAIVRALLAEGEPRVTVIDNLLSGRESNLDEVRDRVDLHVADIRHYDAVAPLVKGAARVFHLAAIPSVPKSILDPIPSHDVNINGTFEVLRACADGKVGRVVYAASSSAYGDTEVLPKTEAMTPNPLSPYAAQKLMGEYYASVFTSCFGLETVALRYFNVYGPRQDPTSPYSGVISIFMKCLLEKKSPTLYGDGNQTRDFTYVEDVAGLCLKASRAPGVSGRMCNAGNGNRYTLNEVWETLQRIEGVSIAANYGPPRAGDVRDSQADTTAAVALLGHAPRFTLEEGLRRTLAWYRASQ
ncbi:MAG: SDR family oxidoreductase [Acidobacteria bacterium]|nr:SDR family oxidoreductase [Acidobacteriota bacterium]